MKAKMLNDDYGNHHSDFKTGDEFEVYVKRTETLVFFDRKGDERKLDCHMHKIIDDSFVAELPSQ